MTFMTQIQPEKLDSENTQEARYLGFVETKPSRGRDLDFAADFVS